jgi:hypothetical protein
VRTTRGDITVMSIARALKSLGIAGLIAVTTTHVTACGTHEPQVSPSSSPPAPATSAKPTPQRATKRGLCEGLTWPRPMPAVVGSIVNNASGLGVEPLQCLHGVRWVGPDGSIVPAYDADNAHLKDGWLFRIGSVSPPPGAPVGPNDPVTVNLSRVDHNESPAFHPCDWLSTTEAAGLLGGTPVEIRDPPAGWPSPNTGNFTGSTDMACEYKSPDGSHDVQSELRLTGTRVVDAATEFAAWTTEEFPADASRTVGGMGIKAACTPVPRNWDKHELWVLLPGERIYIATGFGGESCDTLTEFAQAAISGIGR